MEITKKKYNLGKKNLEKTIFREIYTLNKTNNLYGLLS